MRWIGLFLLIAAAFLIVLSASTVTANWTALYIGLGLLPVGGVLLVVGLVRRRGATPRWG